MRALPFTIALTCVSLACATAPSSNAGLKPPPKKKSARTAIQVAAEHAGVEEDAVEVLTMEAMDFPTSALGCPQPDMAYAPAHAPGYIVEVEVSGADGVSKLDVRVAEGYGRVCEDGPNG